MTYLSLPSWVICPAAPLTSLAGRLGPHPPGGAQIGAQSLRNFTSRLPLRSSDLKCDLDLWPIYVFCVTYDLFISLSL